MPAQQTRLYPETALAHFGHSHSLALAVQLAVVAMGIYPTGAVDEITKQTYPESRVLLIITGGTICMQPSAGGLVPVDGFLKNAMAPRPSFNDMSDNGM